LWGKWWFTVFFGRTTSTPFQYLNPGGRIRAKKSANPKKTGDPQSKGGGETNSKKKSALRPESKKKKHQNGKQVPEHHGRG